jgi:hypothetical protein
VEEKRNYFQKKYEDVTVLLEKIEAYFNETPIEDQTRAGLCIYLGISMTTYRAYKNDNGLHEAIEWADTRLENKYEYDLNKKNNPTAPIFALKQYGWADKSEQEIRGSGSFKIVTNIPRPNEEEK